MTSMFQTREPTPSPRTTSGVFCVDRDVLLPDLPVRSPRGRIRFEFEVLLLLLFLRLFLLLLLRRFRFDLAVGIGDQAVPPFFRPSRSTLFRSNDPIKTGSKKLDHRGLSRGGLPRGGSSRGDAVWCCPIALRFSFFRPYDCRIPGFRIEDKSMVNDTFCRTAPRIERVTEVENSKRARNEKQQGSALFSPPCPAPLLPTTTTSSSSSSSSSSPPSAN